MIYEVGMFCKHFKGEDLYDKNIYKIEEIGIDGKDIDEKLITYTGEGELILAKNLIVYSNIFQNNNLFAREYEDISSYLTIEKQQMYNQQIKVQPLTSIEIDIINSQDFIREKKKLVLSKYKK